MTAPERMPEQTRRDLEQARARAMQLLQQACDRRRRAELERTIEDLDRMLSAGDLN